MATTSVTPFLRCDLDANLLRPAWVALNPNGLPAACFVLEIFNNTNMGINVSLDGINPHFYLAAGTDKIYDFQTNSQLPGKECLVAKGTVIYVSATAAGIGTVMLSGFYV
jgi:hypothetical protein